jgi:hypothetical protein
MESATQELAKQRRRESGEREYGPVLASRAEKVSDSRSVSLAPALLCVLPYQSLSLIFRHLFCFSNPSLKSVDYYVVSGHGLSFNSVLLLFLPQLPPSTLDFLFPASPFTLCTSRSKPSSSPIFCDSSPTGSSCYHTSLIRLHWRLRVLYSALMVFLTDSAAFYSYSRPLELSPPQ